MIELNFQLKLAFNEFALSAYFCYFSVIPKSFVCEQLDSQF